MGSKSIRPSDLPPNMKLIVRTNRKGQKFVIGVAQKNPYPRGKGVRFEFKRGSASFLTGNLATIKRNQEIAEKRAKVKRGNGLFDNPLSVSPRVIGVKRIIRKKQIAAKLRQNIKLSKKDIARLSRKQAGQSRAVTAGDLTTKRRQLLRISPTAASAFIG